MSSTGDDFFSCVKVTMRSVPATHHDMRGVIITWAITFVSSWTSGVCRGRSSTSHHNRREFICIHTHTWCVTTSNVRAKLRSVVTHDDRHIAAIMFLTGGVSSVFIADFTFHSYVGWHKSTKP